MKRRVMAHEVMVEQVRRAHIRAQRMANELDGIAQELHGTQAFVPAFEKVLDLRRAERWLGEYLDELRAIH